MRIELDATEEKIVNATFDIIQDEGFAKSTTKKIATKAGVNEVTIFRKFENKNNLIELTKAYYMQKFVERLEQTFDYTGDEEIGEYLENNFYRLLELSDEDFNVIKVAMEEVGENTDKTRLISVFTDAILDKLEGYFQLQIERGVIREVNPRVLGAMCYSVTFQAIVLFKVYGKETAIRKEEYGKSYLDILFNGIKK